MGTVEVYHSAKQCNGWNRRSVILRYIVTASVQLIENKVQIYMEPNSSATSSQCKIYCKKQRAHAARCQKVCIAEVKLVGWRTKVRFGAA